MGLPSTASSAGVARTFLRQTLAEWGLDAVSDDAELVATELVTNGLVHGGGSLSITMTATGDRLRIAVRDANPAHSPQLAHRGLTAENGRGLALVDAIATGWGVSRGRLGRGKVVWCELATPW